MVRKSLKLLSFVTTSAAIMYLVLGFIHPDKITSLSYRTNGGIALIISTLVIPQIIKDLEV